MALKMEGLFFSETLAHSQNATQCNNREDRHVMMTYIDETR
jgi:hypothetical protein